MTIVRAFKRASGLNDPAVPLTSETLAAWLGGGRTKAGTLVSEQRVFGLPAYYRGMAIRSGVEAALPLKVYKRGTRERIVRRTVLDRPGFGQTPFQFWQTTRSNGIGWGNSFALKGRDGSDTVVSLKPLHPSKVRVEPVDPTGSNPAGKLFLAIDRRGVEHRLTPWEVFHIPWMSPDGMLGVTALQAFRESLGMAIAAEDAAGSLFANGSRLSGILKSKLNLKQENADALKLRWNQKMSGPDHAGEIAVLDNDTEYQPISISPRDSEMLLSRQWSVTEIARMIGVLPHMIGDTDKSTSWGTGIESQFIGWVQTTIGPGCVNVEQAVTAELLPSELEYAEFTVDGILRGDSAARSTFYKAMRDMGVYSQNDILILENREPVDGGDEYVLPAGVLPVEVVETKAKVESLSALVKAGFEPSAACAFLGITDIGHTGLVPTTVTVAESLTNGGGNAPSTP